MKNKITVIDSIMGSGKTSWAKQYMRENTNKKFLFITPYLDQIESLMKDDVINVITPDDKETGSKLRDFKNIIRDNPRIVATTHSLFLSFDEECQRLVEGYTLIIDETPDLLDLETISSDEIRILLDSGAIKIEDQKVYLTNKYQIYTLLSELISKIKANKISCYQDSVFIEQPSPNIFRSFDNIIILTYMFEASIFCCYLEYYGFEYNKKSIVDEKIAQYKYEDGSTYKNMIHIYTGNLNTNISQKYSALSKTWFDNTDNKNAIKKLKNNIYNYFRNISDKTSSQRMWTSFKNYQHKLEGKGYTKAFVACNARASNEYSDRTDLAYCLNRYINPVIKNLYLKSGIIIEEDEFALSQMLQWIWRSAIRKNPAQPISIYIPSIRMRTLLYRWLGYSDHEISEMELNQH